MWIVFSVNGEQTPRIVERRASQWNMLRMKWFAHSTPYADATGQAGQVGFHYSVIKKTDYTWRAG